MKPTSNPTTKKSSYAGSAPTHFVQEHKGLCILALSASFKGALPTERWDEIRVELQTQVLELTERLHAAVHFVEMPLYVAEISDDVDPTHICQRLCQEDFIIAPRGMKGASKNRTTTRSTASMTGASRA